MSKNLIVILYFGLAAIGLILIALIAIFAPEQLEAVVQQVAVVLGLASGAAVTIYLLGTQGRAIEQQTQQIADVKAQTNGTLSALREEKAQLQTEKDDLQRQLLQVVNSAPPIEK